MTKKEIRTSIREKKLQKRSLSAKVNKANNSEELRSINKELDGINNEIDELEDKLYALEDAEERGNQIDPNIAAMEPPPGTKIESRGKQLEGRFNPMGTYAMASNNLNQRGDNSMDNEEITQLYEKRGQDLKEKRSVSFDMKELAELRAVTISSGTLVTPTQTSNTLNPAFNQVSSTIDLVNAVPLMGGEAYKKGFIVGYGEGGETAEDEDYTDAEPVMDYVTIGKCKVTAYCEMSEESVKLTNVDYQAEVAKNINIAIRKKISKQILIGVGGENQIKGIFKAPVNVIPLASDLSISGITSDTLDKIVFGYGGDEDVEGNCYLILNKVDLAAFAAIRSTTGEKLYKITLNGNTGTISSEDSYSVQFILNSACPALSATATVADTYCMAYGKLLGYEMPIFSPVEVQESRDFKFKSGQVCFKGSVYTGGSVAMYKGFTRIKKSA